MKARNRIRFGALVAGVAMIASACGGDDASTAGDSSTAAEVTAAPDTETTTPEAATVPATSEPRAAVGVLPDGPSAFATTDHPDFPPPLVDPDDIVSGGPPPDGIPPIDDPKFIPVMDNLDLLPEDEPVVVLEIEGDARAYPVRIMIWHEIVNDTVGGVPVSITYCPLCNSAVSYVRVIDGVETTFGTSGRLYASALVMYDRATESLWTHFDGRAVVGVLAGRELEVLASPLMSWDRFRATYPDGLVLDENETGHTRRYGSNPYVGYDNPDAVPFLFRGDVDVRARAMQRVVGIETGDDALAVAIDVLSGEGSSVTPVTVGGSELVVFWEPGQSTALEARGVAEGRDVGTVGVFVPETGGESLTFEIDDDTITDIETGSSWTTAGIATAGALQGTQLARIPHLDTFWFAWSTYQPETTLIDGTTDAP